MSVGADLPVSSKTKRFAHERSPSVYIFGLLARGGVGGHAGVWQNRIRLLRNRAAGDAISGVSRGIGLQVVRFGMNDQSRSSITENGTAVVTEINVQIRQRSFRRTVVLHGEIQHIARMWPVRVLQAMLFAFGIEMPAG